MATPGPGWNIQVFGQQRVGICGRHTFLQLISMASVRLEGLPLVQSYGMKDVAVDVRWIAALALCLLTTRGVLSIQRSLMKAIGIIALVYLVQIIVYPWHMGPRALVVLLPLLWVWTWHGMGRWLPRSFGAAPFRVLGLSLLLCVNIGANCYLARADARGFRQTMQGEWESIDRWLATNVAPGEVVAASSTLPVYRFKESSGRKFAEDDFPPAMDFVVVMPGKALRPRADYLLASAPRWNALQSIQQVSTPCFSIAHQSPKAQFLVLRVERDLPQHEQRGPEDMTIESRPANSRAP